MTTTHEPEVLEREVESTLQAVASGSVDVQVATAKRYPRSITTFIRRATEMATLTPEIAASCVYALPRGRKTIEGPSARLAEIVAHAWGNLRIQAGASEQNERYITGRGEAWDLESNVAIGFEVRRRITNQEGETYNDDMITVTGNAAASIALRNAVFKAVPSSFWRPIYLKCRQVIAGDAKTFAARRDDMLKAFMVAGVTPERLCAGIGLKGVQDITLDHMATLVGILNSIKEGETTIEDAFPEAGGMGSAPQPAQRKSQQAPSAPAAETAKPEPEPTVETPKAPADAPAYIGTIADIRKVGNGALVALNTGFVAQTKDPAFVTALEQLAKDQRIVELTTKPSSDPKKYAPVLTEITPVAAE